MQKLSSFSFSKRDKFLTIKVNNLKLMVSFLIAMIGLPLLITFLGGAFTAMGLSWFIFITGVSIGSFFGFIFSVPRIISETKKEGVEVTNQNSDEKDLTGNRFLRTNSNLEQISDWLTTLIVGVALVNIRGISEFFSGFHEFLKKNILSSGDPNNSLSFLPVAGTLLIIIGLVVGFLGMYLGTRVKLSYILNYAEQVLLNRPLTAYEVEPIVEAARLLPKDSGIDRLIKSGVIYPEEALNIMSRLLYEPEGYYKVIDIANILTSTKASFLPTFWFYLSAAYGQMYSKLLENQGSEEEASNARTQALNAARRAVSINPKFRDELYRISTPTGPDDDLKDLRDDPEFISIVRGNIVTPDIHRNTK